MTEYIDRDRVLELAYYLDLDYFMEIPAADVAPVVHGRWDDVPNRYVSVACKDGSYSGHVTSCSVCHEINPNAYKTNYCPNCGAKMDGRNK